MSGYCKLPTSKLHKELIQRSGNVEWANLAYSFSKTKAFDKLFGDKVLWNETEPDIDSFLSLFNVQSNFTQSSYIKHIENQINIGLPKMNYEVVQRAVEFNDNNKQYYATVTDLNNQQSHITIHIRDGNEFDTITNLKKNLETFRNIDFFLKKIGIGISILDPKYFNGESGLMIPANLNKVTNGFFSVINIANNIAGFNSLTEEFSHFLIECCQNNPIIQRCEQYLSEHPELCRSILGDEFDAVNNYYINKGNPDLLYREVLGRILADSINNHNTFENNLFNRSKTVLQNFITSNFQLRTDDLVEAYEQIQTALQNAVFDFIDHGLETKEWHQNFTNNSKTLAHTVTLARDSLQDIKTNLLANVDKYIHIYEHKNIRFSEQLQDIFGSSLKQKNLTNGWIKEYEQLMQGVNISDENFQMLCDEYATLSYFDMVFKSSSEFLQSAYDNFETLYNELDGNFDFVAMTKYATVIRGLRNMVLVYKENLSDLRSVLYRISKRDLTTDINIQKRDELEQSLDLLESKIGKIENQLATVSKKVVYNFCMPFFNENGEDELKIAGTSISKELVFKLSHILNYVDGDINPIKMVLDTAYNSSDMLTQIISTAIKNQQEKIRVQTLQDASYLNSLSETYDVRNMKWMHEVDEFGNPTGYYINEYGVDWIKFEKAKAEDFEAIENDPNLNAQQKKNMQRQWYTDNTHKVYLNNYQFNPLTGFWEIDPNEHHKIGITVPYRNSRWESKAYDNLSDAQKTLYSKIMEQKHKLDCINGLNGSKRYFKCVQKMVTSAVEATMSGNRNVFMRLISNKLKFTSEDLEYGDANTRSDTATMQEDQQFWNKTKKVLRQLINNEEGVSKTKRVLTDFERNVYRTVPLNYVTDLDDINKQMLSTNVFDSILHYTAATYQHAGMNEIADIMELTLSIAKQREVLKYDSNHNQMVSGDDDNLIPVTENAFNANVTKQLEYTIRSQIYSQYKNPGTLLLNGNISTAKLTDGILRLTSLGLLGYNPFTALNNVLVGRSQLAVEGFLGEDTFNLSDLRNATVEYYRLLADGGLGELCAISKDSKLYLLEKTFNPEKSWFQDEINKGVYQPTTLKFLEKLGPSWMMAAGEHHLKYVGLLAMLYHTKMIGPNNEESNLYDALEEYEETINGQTIKSLRIKNGYRKPDGKEFTFYTQRGRSDLQKFINKLTIVNHKMHGIFDNEDYIMLKSYELGRMLMLFRNFMVPYLQKRWKGSFSSNRSTYNLQLGTRDDGSYVTTVKFLKQLFFPNTEFITENGNIAERYRMIYDGLSTEEKANLTRFLSEFILSAASALLLYFCFRDWDDDENVWTLRAANYFLRRLNTELTYAWYPGSILEILQSPTAVMGPLQDILRVIKSIGDDHILQSGPYKGMTRFKANFLRAMPIVPSIKDFFNLDTEDKRFKIFEDSFFYKNHKEEEQNKYAA